MTTPQDVELVVLDVNETLSDVAGLDGLFAEVGLAGRREAWFAGVLRDAFALTVHGENPAFADLARDGVLAHLDGHLDGAARQRVADRVVDAFASLDPHPDVAPGLRGLRDLGLRVVTLSNGSAALAEGLLDRAGVGDLVERYLSVSDASAWKPHPDAYRHALRSCDVEPGAAMLVAVHPWDCDGAARAGLRSAWVSRGGPAAYPGSFTAPDLVVTGLDDLATALRADRAPA